MCFCKNSLSSLQKQSVVNVNTVASLGELLKRWRLAETLKTDRHLWGGGQDRRLEDQEWGLKVKGDLGHGEEELGGIDFWGKFCLTSYGVFFFVLFFLLFFNETILGKTFYKGMNWFGNQVACTCRPNLGQPGLYNETLPQKEKYRTFSLQNEIYKVWNLLQRCYCCITGQSQMWLKGVVLPYSRKCIIYYHTVVNVVKSHQNLWVLRQDLFLYIRDWPQIHNPTASTWVLGL